MNIKVDFDNIVVKEDKNDFNVKILMLKGEKGDAGAGEDNVIEEVQVNGTTLPVTNKAVNVLVPIVDNAISSSSTNPVQNKVIYEALSDKVDGSELNNYYEISEVDNLLDNKVDASELNDYYAKSQTYNQNEINSALNNKADTSTVEAISSTLSNKANSNDVASTYETIANHNTDISALRTQITSLASGSPIPVSSTSQMTDTTKIYVNTTDGYWYYYNGSDWVQGEVYQSTGISNDSIGYDELKKELKDKYILNNNLVNQYEIINGKYLNYNTGNTMDNADYSVTDFIAVEPNTAYYIDNNVQLIPTITNIRYLQYGTNKDYLNIWQEGGANYNSSITTGENTYYIRIAFYTPAKDNIYLSPVEHKVLYNAEKLKINGNEIQNQSQNGEAIINSSLPISSLKEYQRVSNNIYNPNNNLTLGYALNSNSGLPSISNVDYSTSEYLRIKPSTTYTIKGTFRICLYDDKFNYISYHDGNVTFTTKANEKYYRLSFANNSSVFLNEGSTSLNDTYKYRLKGLELLNENEFIKTNISNLLEGNETLQIKLLGDSITHGVGGTGFAEDGQTIVSNETHTWKRNTNGYCWAKLLKDELESKYNCTVINNGCTGTSSPFIVANISTLISNSDNVVICMIGTNNRINSTGFNSLYSDLQTIYNYCKERNIKFIPMASIPASITDEERENGTFSVRYKHMEDVNYVISSFAYNNKLEYIDLFEPFFMYCFTKGVSINTLLADGLHPNDNGYYLMYRIIMKNLGLVAKIQNATW